MSTLEPNAAKVVEQLLHALRTAVGTLRMYSLESPISQNALQGLHTVVESVVKDSETLMISDTEGGLILDGKHPLNVKGIHEMMLAHKIRNIKLLNGTTLADISAFCEGMSKKLEDLEPHIDLNSWLSSRGVEHIQTDDIRYIDIGEDEKVVLRGKGAYTVDGNSGLVQSVKETLNNISK